MSTNSGLPTKIVNPQAFTVSRWREQAGTTGFSLTFPQSILLKETKNGATILGVYGLFKDGNRQHPQFGYQLSGTFDEQGTAGDLTTVHPPGTVAERLPNESVFVDGQPRDWQLQGPTGWHPSLHTRLLSLSEHVDFDRKLYTHVLFTPNKPTEWSELPVDPASGASRTYQDGFTVVVATEAGQASKFGTPRNVSIDVGTL